MGAPPAAAPPPEVPSWEETEEIKEQEQKARKVAMGMKGRSSTILTGALGDMSTANVQTKTLLGG